MPKRVDANQKQIVESLRKIGCSVTVLSMVGKGCPDILVGKDGKNFLFEIKDGEKVPSQKKLTPDEVKFRDNWRGQVDIVESINDAVAIIFAFKKVR